MAAGWTQAERETSVCDRAMLAGGSAGYEPKAPSAGPAIALTKVWCQDKTRGELGAFGSDRAIIRMRP